MIVVLIQYPFTTTRIIEHVFSLID